MNRIPKLCFLLLFFGLLLAACDDFIEPSISKSTVTLEAPADNYTSSSYSMSFWWDEVEHALTYHLQVVSQSFASPGSLVLDTVVAGNKFTFNFDPGVYQWRVLAANGSTKTAYTAPRTFTVASSSITTQTVQLSAPANSYLTNQTAVTLQWGTLFGATKYQVEIDTNNFANESVLLLNETLPENQLSFTFPKDQTYQWRIKAENDTAQAKWSAVYTMTYDHTPPGAVQVTAPADKQTSSLPVAMQWTATPTAAKYKVYVFKSDSVTLYNNNFPVTVTSNAYSFNLGSSGDQVYWKISAVDAAGNEGPASALRSFNIQ